MTSWRHQNAELTREGDGFSISSSSRQDLSSPRCQATSNVHELIELLFYSMIQVYEECTIIDSWIFLYMNETVPYERKLGPKKAKSGTA